MYAELRLRECRTCSLMKEQKEFHRISRGKATTQPDCRQCRSDYEFARGLMRNYGMTVAEYNDLLEQQNHCCDCCGRHKSLFKRRLHVDHNHETGEIRALLCTICNPLIGYAQEDIEMLEKAGAYLRKFKK
jgi:hypothetical protein